MQRWKEKENISYWIRVEMFLVQEITNVITVFVWVK